MSNAPKEEESRTVIIPAHIVKLVEEFQVREKRVSFEDAVCVLLQKALQRRGTGALGVRRMR